MYKYYDILKLNLLFAITQKKLCSLFTILNDVENAEHKLPFYSLTSIRTFSLMYF